MAAATNVLVKKGFCYSIFLLNPSWYPMGIKLENMSVIKKYICLPSIYIFVLILRFYHMLTNDKIFITIKFPIVLIYIELIVVVDIVTCRCS